jgi:transposase InsO family protein
MSLNNRPENVHDERMKIIMNVKHLQTLQQVTDFLHGSGALEPVSATKGERYQWIEQTLHHFRYASRSKAEKGLLIAYLCRISGYSRQQITRLIQRFLAQGRLTWDVSPAKGFVSHYTAEDIRLLAEIDALHDTPSGPAVKKLCERAWQRFGDLRFKRLAGISVAHLYNLRKRTEYRKVRIVHEKTRPVKNTIGVRRKPDPQGRPGFIRIDTVHQGDLDGVKGLYHINAVDEVTQFEVVFTVERISEQFLIPALAALLESFPFQILGFHADNGSEYINRRVAELLEKLRIELTKSRSRHCNDNALAESKNASVVRKILGYCHIPQKFAPRVNRFNQEHLVPYVNYHRPCFFPEIITDSKGRQRKRYRYEQMTTPYEKLKSLPDADQFLKPGLSFQSLDDIAYSISDNEAAERLQDARRLLFESIDERLLAG